MKIRFTWFRRRLASTDREPSLARKLFIDAQAAICVPSTEK